MTTAPLDARRGRPGAPRRRATGTSLIIGGGIVGSGALLDATSRGLKAALIEQDDLAVGTSSRSSRLIHGGLRYLEDLRLQLVREALAERSRLLHAGAAPGAAWSASSSRSTAGRWCTAPSWAPDSRSTTCSEPRATAVAPIISVRTRWPSSSRPSSETGCAAA